MPDLQFHFLNARADLRDIEAWSLPLLRETHALATARLKLRPLDIVIRPGKRVVLQKGHAGHASEPGVIFLTLDLENPALRANPDRSLERMFAHELHHAARWDGPGYGRTLGAALVSEGLAGQFAQELFGGPPEPWESLDPSDCLPFRDMALRDWSDIRYNHADWFFGTGDMPLWLGYSLGFRMVGRYLSDRADLRASALAGTEADEFQGALARAAPV